VATSGPLWGYPKTLSAQRCRRSFALLFSASSDTLQDMDNTALTPQQLIDNEHLKLLSIFHYIMGGLSALFSTI
jgi:hypothetical protein